jgi:hypothetical protein
MGRRDPDLVTASELAAWAWCPESWRLDALGHEPENRTALEQGEAMHARTATVAERSRAATSLGRWLLVAAAVLAALALVLTRP